MNGGIETHRRAAAFMGNAITILGLLVLGYPLSPAALRSMLLGWVLFVVATMQFYLGALSPDRKLCSSKRRPRVIEGLWTLSGQ